MAVKNLLPLNKLLVANNVLSREHIFKFLIKLIKTKQPPPLNSFEFILVMQLKGDATPPLKPVAGLAVPSSVPKGGILQLDNASHIPKGFAELVPDVGIMPTRMAFIILLKQLRKLF